MLTEYAYPTNTNVRLVAKISKNHETSVPKMKGENYAKDTEMCKTVLLPEQVQGQPSRSAHSMTLFSYHHHHHHQNSHYNHTIIITIINNLILIITTIS